MSKVIDWIFDHRWAITPHALENIISIASRDSSVDKIIALSCPDAIATRDAEALQGARRAEVRDGVAVLNITGPIFPRAGLFTMVSGATSIATLAKDFQVALDDNQVEAIVLNIDSPGGEVTGVAEFADMIASARDIKPIVSYIYGIGASAAYWIASAAGKVVMAETAEAGSIGVVSAWTSTKERDKKSGVESIEIVSSVSPRKRPDPATDEGRAQIQAVVDDIADVFVGTVARNRGVSAKYVAKNFGQGDVMIAKRAISAGMADSLGSFESVIKSYSVNKTTMPMFSVQRSTMNALLLKEKHADVYAAIIEEGKIEGVAAGKKAGFDEGFAAGVAKGLEDGKKSGAEIERERIKGIESIKCPGSDSIVSVEKYNPTATKESVAVKIVESQSKLAESASSTRQAEAAVLAGQLGDIGTPATGTPSTESENATVDAAIKASVDKINARR